LTYYFQHIFVVVFI